MVLLENIHFQELKPDDFRSFKCLCELCDDGCFDRLNQTHHPECTKRLEKNKNKNKIDLTHAAPNRSCPVSHYKDTFKPNLAARPATVYQPPPDKFEYLPKGSIDLNTIQKTNYKPFQITERTKPFKAIESLQLPTEPFNAISAYQQEYTTKEKTGFANIVKKNANESIIKVKAEKLSTNTTNKEHFKGWNGLLDKNIGFSEHPSHAGFALFPGRERSFMTSTKAVHQPNMLERKVNNEKAEMKGNLKIEGQMDFETNYRKTFMQHPGFERAKTFIPNHNSTLIFNNKNDKNKKISFQNMTQNKSDFPNYPDHRPPKPADCNPYLSNLNEQLYPGNKYDLRTNYSLQYTKISPNEIDKAKSFKKEEKYEAPTEKFTAETVTKRDFQPIDLSKIPILRAKKVEVTLKVPTGPMETKTTQMIHFMPYDIRPVQFAKDKHPSYYIPPKGKFVGETTNSETFKGIQGKLPKSFKPDHGNIDRNGDIDFNTNYRNTFKNHGLSMCEAKAYLITRSLTAYDLRNNNNNNLENSTTNSRILTTASANLNS